MDKNKSFTQYYKEAKIISFIFLFLGFWLIVGAVIHSSHDGIDQLSIIFLIIGSLICSYTFLFLFLYWKCANYQKKEQSLSKWFRVISAIFFIFYLTFFQLKEDTKTYRQYLLLKEIRFYLLTWIFLCALLFLLECQFIQINNFLWFGISLGIITLILTIDLILTIFIWKYRGINNKLLKILALITLNYRSYKLYKTITELNTKEKTDS